MLFFPSQNDKKKITDCPGILEKSDPEDGNIFLILAWQQFLKVIFEYQSIRLLIKDISRFSLNLSKKGLFPSFSRLYMNPENKKALEKIWRILFIYQKVLFFFHFIPVNHSKFHRRSWFKINPRIYNIIVCLIEDFKNTLINILYGKEDLILKLGQLIKYFKRQKIHRKICWKCTLKTSPKLQFNHWYITQNTVNEFSKLYCE